MRVSSRLLLTICGSVVLFTSLIYVSDFQPSALLCSDGRCGESSRLSRQGAEKDLNLWADKEELKNKLDELQTVMDRGMTHKSATQDLNQYFDKLDSQTRQQRKDALRQAQNEGLDDTTTLSEHSNSHSYVTKLSSSNHREGNMDIKNAQHRHQLKIANSTKQGSSSSKLTSSAALADLDAYFDSLPISRKHDEVS